jgi:hypothetical protein
MSEEQAQGFWNHPAEGIKTSADHLGPLKAKDLLRIARARGDRFPISVWFTRTPGHRFDPDVSEDEPSWFVISSRGVRLVVSERIANPEQVDTTEPPSEWVVAVLKRLGHRFGLRLLTCEFDQQGWAFIEGTYRVPGDYPLSSAVELAAIAQRAIGRVTGAMDIAVTHALLGAGVPEVLLSIHEGIDLEAKRSPYMLSEAGATLELGKDVSALANSRGGLLAVGFATKRDDQGDVISAVVPCRLDLIRPTRHRNTIARVIYPQIRGLEVTRIQTAPGAGYLIIYVPSQPASLKPFLVRGSRSLSRDRIEGNQIGVFHRIGDASVAIAIEELHGLLRSREVLIE